MSVEIFLAGLVGVTFVAVLVFAVTSKRKTDQRMNDDQAPKSSLAADADSKTRAEY